MKYATWKPSKEKKGLYSGPQELIESVGASIETIFSTNPSPETHLSKISGDISSLNLEKWSFTELTKEQAIDFIDTWFQSKPRDFGIPAVLAGEVSVQAIKSRL